MIGVLALQGGFAAHLRMLQGLGHTVREVRRPEHLAGLEGLVLPGGESTAMLHLLGELEPALHAFVREGRPVLATCAGLILAAGEVREPAQRSFGWIDVRVSRNAWGRQLDSFEARADGSGWPLVFIRAPRITAVGPRALVVATLDGEPICVREGNVWGATFHPELTTDPSLHGQIFGVPSPHFESLDATHAGS